MSATTVENRLALLEAEVASLKSRLKDERPWWQEWAGAFLNDPYFEEAMKLGRKWRESQNPQPKKNRGKKHGSS